jgi:hypothetical protein
VAKGKDEITSSCRKLRMRQEGTTLERRIQQSIEQLGKDDANGTEDQFNVGDEQTAAENQTRSKDRIHPHARLE